MNTRGLSDVVTTVLIILLVLAAVVIIWQFLYPTIQNAGKEIAGGSSCTKLDLQVTKCNGTGNLVDITVAKGASDLPITKLVFIGTLADGSTATTEQSTVPTVLATQLYKGVTFGTVGTTDVTKVTVTAKVKTTEQGDETLCTPLAQTFACS